MTFNKFKVMIVDDHEMIRHGMAMLINMESDLEVCYDAGDGPEALEIIKKNKIDVYTGHGSFLDAKTIEIKKDDGTVEKITVAKVIIATPFAPRARWRERAEITEKKENFHLTTHLTQYGKIDLAIRLFFLSLVWQSELCGMEQSVRSVIISRSPRRYNPRDLFTL